MGEINFFDVLKLVLLWVSPVIMLIGSLLLLLSNKSYSQLENKLAKEVGGVKKSAFPSLEANNNSLHNWLLANKNATGLIFIVCAFIIFMVMRR